MGGPLESAVLTELYLLRRRSLLARLAGRVGHWHTAEDLAQDAWVQLTRAVATQPVNRPEAFLNETARNIATDHARRARRRARVETEYFDPAALEDVATDAPSAEACLMERERITALRTALAALPERAQEVWRLSYVEGWSYARIAEDLGVSRNTVYNDMKLVMGHCRDVLRRVEGD